MNKTTEPMPYKYRSSQLFLLIGRNLLPNYVAAHMLLEPGGTIYLVHSSATETAAQNLTKILVREGFVTPQRISIRSGHPEAIWTRVREAALEALGRSSTGLNYTGGTKVMAVHAHRAMTQAGQELRKPVILSYLDANERQIVIDPLGTGREYCHPVSLAVQPSLHDLLCLHGIQLVWWAPLRQPFLPQTAGVLAGVHVSEAGRMAWRDWCRRLKKGPRKFHPSTVLRELHLPDMRNLAHVSESVRSELGLPPGNIKLGALKPLSPWARLASNKAMEELAAWFDGKWLEHYTFHQLQGIAADQDLHREGMGIGLQTDRSKTPYDFEVDVAAMRGYQLFALACTRSDVRQMCTTKLLEVSIRSSQLGGEEARAGLVCCSPEPLLIKQQVEDAWGVKDRVRVFGCDDLLSLADRLTKWIESTP
jgi:hypothetical protein